MQRAVTQFLLISIVIFYGLNTSAHAADFKHAKPAAAGFSEPRLERISELADSYISNGKYSGIVTLIARDGKIVHHKATGRFGVDNDKPVELDSLFRIYSMTKPVTAVATLILLEQGKIHLDDPIAKHLPEFANTKVLVGEELKEPDTPISIRHLLTHTAGMTYGWTPDNPVDVQYAQAKLLDSTTMDEFVDKLAPIPLRFQPGTRYFYSVSFDVLGALIERVSERPLDAFFTDEIFAPLGMQDTFFEVPDEKRHRLLDDQAWDLEQNRIITVPAERQRNFTDVAFFMAGGGLVSTAEDYLRFSQMILNGGELNGNRILSPKTVALLSSNQLTETVRANGVGEYPTLDLYAGQSMGFGYGVVTNAALMPDLSSHGELSWGGVAGTKFWIDPKEKIIGIAMVQQYQAPWPLRSDLKNATYQALETLY